MSSDSTHAMPHADVVPGVFIGPWVVRERWDRGSFGVVFRVQRAGHPELGAFALKLALQAEDARMEREVALLQSLQHPSVPRFEDHGWWDSPRGGQFPYVVMEWVEGVPLYEWARARRRTSRQVLQILEQLASALAFAHASGAVHRDVKGDNILVTAEGRSVLLDWGCGIHLGARELTDGPLGPGTSAYRSPESLRWSWAHRLSGERYEPTGRDDVYALGVTAYRLTTGTYPPPVEEASGPPRRLFPPRDLATVSAGLDELLLACLHEDPRRRPPASSLVVALGHAARKSEAASPIVPTFAEADTDKARRPGPRRSPLMAWLSAAGAAVATVALLCGASVELRARGWSGLLEPRGPSREVPDAGVGDEALAAIEVAPRTYLPPVLSVGRALPTNPFPGQKKPPCDPESQRAIMGVCWAGPLGKKKPPCGPEAYDFEDGCYLPIIIGPAQPTSEDPR